MLRSRNEIFKGIILSIFSIIFILLSLEIISRFFFIMPFQSFINHSTKTWDPRGMPFIAANIRPSRSLGYEFVPNSKLGTNSLGMLDRERMKEKPKDNYRIICIGDSTTANSDYVGILEDLLNRNQLNRRFEVWNCGVPGYGAIQYYKALKEKWLMYDPDMVIIGFCLNDFATTPFIIKESDHFVGYFPWQEIMPHVSPFLLKHSALYRFIIGKIFMQKGYKNTEDIIRLSRSYLKDVKDLLSEEEIPLLIVIFGLVERFENYHLYGYADAGYENIKSIIKEYNIESIDMVPIFEKHGAERLRQNKGDELHFNQEGGRIISAELYDYLIKTKVR